MLMQPHSYLSISRTPRGYHSIKNKTTFHQILCSLVSLREQHQLSEKWFPSE